MERGHSVPNIEVYHIEENPTSARVGMVGIRVTGKVWSGSVGRGATTGSVIVWELV